MQKTQRIKKFAEMKINVYIKHKTDVNFYFPNKKQSINKSNQQCKRGEQCIFKARGTCFYFNKGIGIQSKRDSGENIDTKSKLWCTFQDKSKIQTASFNILNQILSRPKNETKSREVVSQKLA